MTAKYLADKAMGGYLEIEIRQVHQELYPEALAFQSARAAFRALLEAGQPRSVWVPWFICETMTDQVAQAGIEVKRYALAPDLAPEPGFAPASDEWLLYVNYFGTCEAQVDALLDRFPPGQLVIDDSHALFSPPRPCLASIYSPRKFVGAPDGGYLVTSLEVPLPALEDQESARRCMPLLNRAAQGPEPFYADFLLTQETLAHQPPLRMSKLTHALLRSVDYQDAAKRRRANFSVLASLLGGLNQMDGAGATASVPLAYPFIGRESGLREKLIANRIYVPQFWPHLAGAVEPVPAFERMLAQRCLPLPCDQRYAPSDMRALAGLVTSLLDPS